MPSPGSKDQSFPELKTFDEKDFAPPAWATGPNFRWDTDEPVKHGESSKSGASASVKQAAAQSSSTARDEDPIRPDLDAKRKASSRKDSKDSKVGIKGEDGEDEEEDVNSSDEEIWQDAAEQLGVHPETVEFTLPALRAFLVEATEFRNAGNALYSAHPAKLEKAIEKYKAALKILPDVEKGPSTEAHERTKGTGPINAPPEQESGIQEVNEDEADAILEEEKRKAARTPEEIELDDTKNDIRECTKACWGNLGACYASLGNDEEVVKACTKALELDPYYAKALNRRALANERIGSWTALETALKDYQLLIQLLPPASPQLPSIRKALATIPGRIEIVKEEETAKMMGQLKELGNSFLGWFGLSTDNFKFDQQPGGGYSMRFEQ